MSGHSPEVPAGLSFPSQTEELHLSDRPGGGHRPPAPRAPLGADSRIRSPVMAAPAPVCTCCKCYRTQQPMPSPRSQCNTGHRASPASPRSGASRSPNRRRLIVGVKGKFGARPPPPQPEDERPASGAAWASPAGRPAPGRLSPPTPPSTVAASRRGPCPGTSRRARDTSYKVPTIKRPPATRSKPETRGEADDEVTSSLTRVSSEGPLWGGHRNSWASARRGSHQAASTSWRRNGI